MKGILFLVLLSLLLSSCAPGAPPAPTKGAVQPSTTATRAPVPAPETKPATPSPSPKPAAEQPRYGGVLNTTLMSDLAGLDVQQENSLQVQTTLQAAYSGLLQYMPSQPGKIAADLAESWDVSRDSLVYTFRLRKGVKFHDGSVMTAEDVKFSLERIFSPPKGIGSPRRPTFGAVKAVEAPDQDTVRIALKFPQGSLLPMLSLGQIAIYSRQLVEAKGDMKRDVMGTGPFMLKDYSLGTLLELKKNPDYFIKGRPYMDGIRFYVIKDESTKISAFRTGRVRLTDPSLPAGLKPEQAQTIRREMPQAVFGKFASLSGMSVLMVATVPPFNDVRVRRAVNVAVDRQAAIKILWAGEADLGTAFPSGSEWGAPEPELLNLPGYRQPKDADIAEARKLLAEAGFERGLKAKLLARARYSDDLAVLMKEHLARIGMDLEVVVLESGAFLDVLGKRTYPMVSYPISVRTYDPDELISSYSSRGPNRSGLVDESLDALFDKQMQAVDLTERKKLVRELEMKLLELSTVAMVFWQRGNVAYWPEVKNYYRGNPYSTNKCEDVWIAK